MEDEPGVITSTRFRIWLRPDNIFQLVLPPGTVIGREDAADVGDAVTTLAGGHHYPMLVDARQAGPIDKEARIEISSRGDRVSAVAIIVGTPLSRMMGALIMNMSRLPMPMRLFGDEQSAIAWLRTLLE